MLAILTFALCGVYYVFRRRKRNSGARQILPEDSLCGPNYPILKGHTIQDIIELTTSGSGSGKHTRYDVKRFFDNLFFLLFSWTASFGTALDSSSNSIG